MHAARVFLDSCNRVPLSRVSSESCASNPKGGFEPNQRQADAHLPMDDSLQILKQQLSIVLQELEKQKKQIRTQQHSNTPLQDIDKAVAKLRKQNEKLREQVESVVDLNDELRAKQSIVAELAQQIKKRQTENSTLRKLVARQQKAYSDAGPTVSQQHELDRLKKEAKRLHLELRETTQTQLAAARKQQAEHLEWSKLCERHAKLKTGIEESEASLRRGSMGDGSRPSRAISAPAPTTASRLEAKAAAQLSAAKKSREAQKRRYHVRIHDAKSEARDLRALRDSRIAALRAVNEKCRKIATDLSLSVEEAPPWAWPSTLREVREAVAAEVAAHAPEPARECSDEEGEKKVKVHQAKKGESRRAKAASRLQAAIRGQLDRRRVDHFREAIRTYEARVRAADSGDMSGIAIFGRKKKSGGPFARPMGGDALRRPTFDPTQIIRRNSTAAQPTTAGLKPFQVPQTLVSESAPTEGSSPDEHLPAPRSTFPSSDQPSQVAIQSEVDSNSLAPFKVGRRGRMERNLLDDQEENPILQSDAALAHWPARNPKQIHAPKTLEPQKSSFANGIGDRKTSGVGSVLAAAREEVATLEKPKTSKLDSAGDKSDDEGSFFGLHGLGSLNLNGASAAPKGQLLAAATTNKRRLGVPTSTPLTPSVGKGGADVMARDGRPRILNRPQLGGLQVSSRPASSGVPDLPVLGQRSEGLGLNLANLKAPEFDDEIDDEELAREEEEMLARCRAAKGPSSGSAPSKTQVHSMTKSSVGASISVGSVGAAEQGTRYRGYALPEETKPVPPTQRVPVLAHDDIDDLSDEELA